MKRLLCYLIALGLLLAIAAGAAAAPAVEIRLKDGSTWRGEVEEMVEVIFLQQRVEVTFAGRLIKTADLYIKVEGNIAGELREKTIFRGDIISMRTLGDDDEAEAVIGDARPRPKTGEGDDGPAAGDDEGSLGVFVLPMEGTVGGPFRHEEIVQIGEKADEYGPGQVIVLHISSNGGSSYESTLIAKAIEDVKKRHRVVAWIEKAISAGCSTAMCCDEIYFMTEGSAGAVTTWYGSGVALRGEQGEAHMQELVDLAIKNGYSEHVARAMKFNKYECSYTKDPETGEVTFYGDLSGEVALSDSKSNLSFTSSVAADCGFSKGTADTTEELAKLLDLPKWHEVSEYGRRIAKSWQDTYARAEEEIPRLIKQMEYKGSGTGDQVVVLGNRIRIYEKLVRWWDRCPNYCRSIGMPPKEELQREIKRMRKQLAGMRDR